MLPAAWRKMWVSSAIGTGLGLDELGERLAGADRCELVGVSDEDDVRSGPTARRSVTSSSRLAIEVSSTIRRSVSSSSTVGPWSGIQPSAEWTVEASRPLDSDIRRAARPVGATSSTEAFCSRAAAQISRIVAVLPVPGPPVTIESREANAARTAAACSGAGTRSSAGGAPDALRLAGAAASSPTISARSRSSFAVSGGRPRPRGAPARRTISASVALDGRASRVGRCTVDGRARVGLAELDDERRPRRPSRRAARRSARRRAARPPARRARRPAGRSTRRAPPRSGRAGRPRASARASRPGRRPSGRSCRRSGTRSPNTLVRSYGRSRTTRWARGP